MGFLRRAKLSDPVPVPFSKRSVINLSYINSVAHYPFINHVLESNNFATPYGAAFAGVNPSWPEMLDQVTGYPIHANASGHAWGGGLKFPASSKYAGPYVITWDGTGTLNMNQATWTESNNTGATYTKNFNGNWTNVAGQSAYIVATLSGWAGAPEIFGFQFSATGGPDGFVRNIRIYRLEDEADLSAGKVFRRPYLQQISDHDPSALRVMNWSGGNDAHGMRFENRVLPNYASYGSEANWINSPLYGTTSTTGDNQYTLSMVTTGVRQTPASMLHGEIAICRIGSTNTAGTGPDPRPQILSVTAAATPRVVTTTPHGFSNSQRIYHEIAVGAGVPKLDCFPATINVINTTTYDITNLNLTGQAAFTSPPLSYAYVYTTLNVGGRGEGDYPIMYSAGAPGVARFGAGALNAGALQTFYFDKNIIGKSDGAGNYVKGIWIFLGGGEAKGHWDGVPLEILTKLIIELNQMGPKSPISMFISYPHRGLLSTDPDYTMASSWAVQATNIILNGNTVGGVNYPGLLTGASGANLYIEYCNEIWNPIPSSPQSYWHQRFAQSRWGMANPFGPDAHAFRSTAMVRDIKAAYPSETRIKYVMGLWGSQGMTVGGGNHGTWNGSSTPGNSGYLYSTDPGHSVSSAWGPPKSWHDAVGIGPYFVASEAYFEGVGTGSFTDDSALYAGTAPYAGSPNQAQALTNFLNQSKTVGGECLDAWLTRQDQYIAQMGTGQYVIQYEGGPDWQTIVGQSLYDHVITAADETFLVASYRSSQLATIMVNYFDAVAAKPKSAMPSMFLSVNAGYRWALGAPDSYGTTSTEGGTLTTNPVWTALNARNAAIP